MRKKLAISILSVILLLSATGCNNSAESNDNVKPVAAAEQSAKNHQNDLGALSPEKALDYMKNTSNLVLVDVAATKWYEQEHFIDAINIPIENISAEEADKLYKEIPANRPVILHCRRGMIVPRAYQRLKELRPDIPEISYIDGVPSFEEYNEWKKSQK